jgi:hypothetical protein
MAVLALQYRGRSLGNSIESLKDHSLVLGRSSCVKTACCGGLSIGPGSVLDGTANGDESDKGKIFDGMRHQEILSLIDCKIALPPLVKRQRKADKLLMLALSLNWIHFVLCPGSLSAFVPVADFL